jgi:hypothetical protein
MSHRNAIKAVLQMNEKEVYPGCRYSLLHKVISDLTYSSTPTERYTRKEFYWSWDAIRKLMNREGDGKLNVDREDTRIVLTARFTNNKRLHKEHVVPTGLIIRYLLEADDWSDEDIDKAIDYARTVCIVSGTENGRLLRKAMPPASGSFWDDRWARYAHPKDEGKPIYVSPYFCNWTKDAIVFLRRDEYEMKGVPTLQENAT